MTDPMTGLALFNAIATAGKTLYEVTQGVSNLDTKRQLMEVYDTLMSLKREASDLEDENHDLKERLRFKSDDFEFRNPFYFEKRNPDQPLCPKCYAREKKGPMSEIRRSEFDTWRTCLVCDNAFNVERSPRSPSVGSPPTAWS
jgi:hypothetical protein